MASPFIIAATVFLGLVIAFIIFYLTGVKPNIVPNVAANEAKKEMKADVRAVESQREHRINYKKNNFREVVKQIIVTGKDDKHNCDTLRFKLNDDRLSNFEVPNTNIHIRPSNPLDVMTASGKVVDWEIFDDDFAVDLVAQKDHAELKAKARQIELEDARKTDKQRLRETAENVREQKRAMYGFIPQQGYGTGSYSSTFGRPWRVRPIGGNVANNEENEEEQM